MAKQDGLIITIKFTQAILGGEDSTEAFTITFGEYDMTPGGVLRTVSRPVDSVEIDETDSHLVHLYFESGNTHSVQNADGNITVMYSAAKGHLYGEGGPVQSFISAFTPADLTAKTGQNDLERISMRLMAIPELIAVTYIDCQSGDENLSMAISGAGVRTYVGDL